MGSHYQDRHAVGVFVRAFADLTLSATGRGTVIQDPPGTHFDIGTSITLTATPYSGWAFSHWTGDIPPSDVNNPNPTIVMDDNKTIQAVFTESATLTVHIMGGGSVQFDPFKQLHNGPVAYRTVPPGQTISVLAIPFPGCQFDHWVSPAGGTANGTQLDVVMNGPKSATAVFTQADPFPAGNLNLVVGVHGAGTVTVSPPNEDVATSRVFSLPEDQVVTLSATPATGWEFVEWVGDATGSTPSAQVTMTEGMSVNALFVKTGETLEGDFNLNVVVEGGGEVLTDGLRYGDGEYALLIARPAFGWRFDHWEGGFTGTDPIAGVEMDAAKTVVAVFVAGLSIVTDSEILGGSVYFGPEENWILTDPELSNMGFASGASVLITAVPQENYVFSHWEGDITGTSPSVQITLSSHLFIRPVFLPMMPLNVIVAGGGSVQIGQGGPVITDSYIDYYNPLEAAEIVLTPTAAAGYVFDHWESTLPPSGNDTVTAIMDQPTVAVAYMNKLKYKLNVDLSDEEGASLRIMPERAEYDAGTWVEVSVYPEPGYRFTGWTGDATGNENPLLVQVNGDTDIVAEMDEGPEECFLSVSVAEGLGEVTPAGTTSYDPRTPVVVEAVPALGYYFDHWEGDFEDAHGEVLSFSIESDIALRAVFKTEQDHPLRQIHVSYSDAYGGNLEFIPPPVDGNLHKDLTETEHTYLITYAPTYREGTLVQIVNTGTPWDHDYYGCSRPLRWYWWSWGMAGDYSEFLKPGELERNVAVKAADPELPYSSLHLDGRCNSGPTSPLGAFHCTVVGVGEITYAMYYNSGSWIGKRWIYQGATIDRRGAPFVALAREAGAGWHFAGWSWTFNGSTTISSNPSIVVGGPEDGDIEVTAVFEPDAFYALTLLEDGEGTADATPPLHTEGYGLGESIVLEATPDLGWTFSHWTDNTTGGVVSHQNSCVVKAKQANNYTAVFRALYPLTLTTEGQGRVDRTPNSLIYEQDASVTLTAIANPGWEFTGWTGDTSGADNPLQLNMDSPKAITANFAIKFTVKTDLNDDGQINTDDDLAEAQGAKEFFRAFDGMSNGAKYGRTFYLSTGPSGLYIEHDDLQHFHLTIGETDIANGNLSCIIQGLQNSYVLYRSRMEVRDAQGRIALEAVPMSIDLGTYGSYPRNLYLLARDPFTTSGDVDVTFTYTDPGGVAVSDTIGLHVVGGYGHESYFDSARDYIIENHSKFFVDRKEYESDDQVEAVHVLVTRQEATTLRVHDAYRATPTQYGIAEVIADNPQSDIAINGNFQTNVVGTVRRISTGCRGLVVHGGVVLEASEYESTSPVPYQNAKWFGQEDDGTFSFGVGEVPNDGVGGSPYRDAIGGLFGPTSSESVGYTWSLENDWTMMIGEAPVSMSHKVIFILVSDLTTEKRGPGRMGSGSDAFSSGATCVYYLDGGSSVGLAFRDPDGVVRVKESAFRQSMGIPYYIGTYVLFDCQE